MTVKKYGLKFKQLSRYAPVMIFDVRAKMMKFVSGLGKHVTKECQAAMLISDMDTSRLIVYAQQKKSSNYTTLSANAPAPSNRLHLEEYRGGNRGCYNCGKEGHFHRDNPMLGDRAQSYSAEPLSQGNQRGTTAGTGGGPSRLYAMANHQDQENSPDVVTEWKGSLVVPKGRFVSYLRAKKLISKEYIYYIVRVKDDSIESPTLKSVPIVNAFHEVFPEDLPGVPPEREIDFGIDVLPDMQPISIPPYMMDPAVLKEYLRISPRKEIY
ncbi:uncharacterized protein LOC129894662 [Solanum dulcamara]|uniref:uncharacterized protein LOC129894662 n=1 Tax=Solanum dulcamara TaxID=45834 RepID=UPI002485507B|nr:uncharacterized protein LOC129894662 [Solanum dulcamara]